MIGEFMTDRIVDVDVRVKARTDKAVLVTTDDEDEVWIPLSHVEIDDGVATLPEWLAIEKGMV